MELVADECISHPVRCVIHPNIEIINVGKSKKNCKTIAYNIAIHGWWILVRV